MRKSGFVKLVIGAVSLTALATAPHSVASAHEGHHVTCDGMGMNALTEDIQAMSNGDGKTTAMNELEMAEQMMAKHDMDGCKAHMHNAMEATEK